MSCLKKPVVMFSAHIGRVCMNINDMNINTLKRLSSLNFRPVSNNSPFLQTRESMYSVFDFQTSSLPAFVIKGPEMRGYTSMIDIGVLAPPSIATRALVASSQLSLSSTIPPQRLSSSSASRDQLQGAARISIQALCEPTPKETGSADRNIRQAVGNLPPEQQGLKIRDELRQLGLNESEISLVVTCMDGKRYKEISSKRKKSPAATMMEVHRLRKKHSRVKELLPLRKEPRVSPASPSSLRWKTTKPYLSADQIVIRR